MANITVDIQAKVVGYEQSIKSLQAALAKVDPGSDIGKSITKAMEQAQSQVKALSKNMFPKASSDSQIDSIIEKTNRAGEAIQHVAALLQNVQVSDLNLGAFSGDIETFKNQIASLQTELDSKLSAGIVKAVGESEQLKNVFKELGTDLSKATGATLLEDLSKGAQKAADDVADLEKKLEKAQTSINNYQSIDNALKSSKLGTLEGRTALDDELKTITGNYDAIIEELRATMIRGFSKLKTDTKLDTDGLLKTFFSDLTPENVQSHIRNLFDTLSSQGIFGENEKRKFYEAIFGSNNEYNTNNVNLLTKSIGLDEAYEQYKVQLQEFYQKIISDIDGKDQAQIGRLINEGQLEKAVSATTKALDSAYNKIFNSIKQNQERLNGALSDKENITLQLNATQQTRDAFSSAEQQLRQEIEAVRQENKNLENQIVQLREQLNQKLSGEVGNIRNIGITENRNAGQGLRESLEISEAYKNQLTQVAAKEQALGKLQGVVQRWFSIYAAIRMVRQAVNSVISTIQELDKTITEIAIVTSMDQSELWGQMPKYTQLARDYAASISGVYQVSQLYYQQGLQTADVMALTEQTLKMARISGLDYAQATDYMTNAVRSFKMEMTDAQNVVDVYSAIAASSATSVTELASAMSKTASSAQAVGSSFENTTAMMAVMIEATRESAENIGSAMKSIISRYGEMTSDPSKLVDSEGQEMSLNRVDKALQTVGISIHNAAGEFRNFDDVIMELAQKWDTIDTNTQRYIATIMAGNRQQSRFLALVSSYDRLKELSAEAADSEDASQLQFLKTLDSVAAKQQQIQTNIQSLYTSSGIEDFYKTILDLGIKITKTFDELGSGNGLIAIISKIGGTFGSLAILVTNVFKAIKTNYSMVSSEITAKAKLATAEKVYAEVQAHADLKQIWSAEVNDWVGAKEEEVAAAKKSALERVQIEKDAIKQQQALRKELAYQNRWQTRGMAVTALGLGASTIAATMDTSTQRVGKGVLTGIGGVASGIGTGMMLWQTSPIVAAIMGLVSAIPSILEAFNILNVSVSEKVSQMQEDLTSKSDEKIKSNDTLKTLESYKQKWDELNISQYESNEKREEFLQLNNDIAASYPELISRMDEEGNYIVNMVDGYKQLAEAKREAYKGDLIKAAAQEVSNYEDSDYLLKQIYNTAPLENQKVGLFNLDLDSYEGLLDIDYSQEDFANEVQQIFSTRGVTNANMRTAERLFGGEKKNLSVLSSTLTDEDIYLTKESENILSQLYLAFIEQIKSGVDQVTAEANLISSGEFDSKYNELIKNFDTEFYTQLQKYLNLSNFSDTLSDNKMSTYMTEYIDILSGSVEDMGIESSKIQKRYMKERLLEAWKNSDDKKIFDAETDVEERKKIIEDFFNKHGNAWYYATFTNQEDVISTLTKEQNEFYENLGKYTLEEIEKMFPDDATMDSIFHKDYDDTIKNYTEWYNKSNVLFDTITDFSQLFGPEYLSQIQGSYQNIISSASSKTIKNERLKALDDIYKSIDQTTSLAPDQKNMVLEKVISGDLFSLTGISNLIESLDTIQGIDFNTDAAAIKESILKFKDFIPVNLNTEINSVLESYSEGLQSLSDSLNKASKGMNLKEAVKAADELGLTLADFNQSGNKFYIKDLTKLKDHYIKIDTEQRTDIQKEIDQQKELYQQLETGYMIGSTDSFDFEKYKDLPTLEERRAYYEGYAAELQEFVPLLNTFDKFDTAVMSSPDTSLKQVSEEMQSKVLNRRKNFNLNELLTNKTADDFTKISNIIDEEYATLLSESGINVDSLKNDIKAYLESKSDKSFSQYIAETQGEELAKIYEASEEAVNYLLASTAISQGNLDSFLDLVFGKEGAEGAIKVDRETIKNQIAIGETDNLPKELQKYSTLIQDTFKSVRETTINALISAIGDGSTQIKVTDLNKGILEQLKGKQWIEGDIKTGEYVTIAAQNLLDNAQAFEQYIVSSFDTNAERIKALTETHKNQYANSRVENYGKIAGAESFAYEDLLNYINEAYGFEFLDESSIEDKMSELGLAFDSMGNVIIDNYDLWIAELESEIKVLAFNGANQQELNHASALLEQTRNQQEQSIDKAFSDLLKDPSIITSTAIESLANSLSMTYDEVISYLISNDNGTYRIDTSQIEDLVNKSNEKVSAATLQSIKKSIGSATDTYSESIKKAQDYLKNGTTSRAEMETFIQQFQEATGETLDIDKAFTYDSEKKTWKLGSDYLLRYAYARGEQLAAIDEDYEDYVSDLLKNDVTESVQQAIEALTTGNKDARQKLDESILNYYTNLFNTDEEALDAAKEEFSEVPQQAELATNVVKKAVEGISNFINDFGKSAAEEVTVPSRLKALGMENIVAWEGASTEGRGERVRANAEKAVEAEQTLVKGINEELDQTAEELTRAELIRKAAEHDINTMLGGGSEAVEVYKRYNANATQEELDQVFYSRINALTSVMDKVSSLVAGQFVGTEGKLHDVLARAGAIDPEADGVVAKGFSMVEVYAAIYAEMSATAGKTTAGLNDAYAKLLTAQDQSNIDITEALKNGNGISYADFGNLLAKYDIKFEDYMTQHYDAVMRDGFGNIRITDWNAFAKSIWGDNLDQVKNTQEYTSAFKAYNDGLIELNKNTEQAIVNEIKQIESAKAGDWINLSQLWTAIEEALPSDDWTTYMGKAKGDQTQARAMQNQDWYKSVLGELNLWGASLEDGILKIGDNANLLGIAQTLERAAQEAGLELGNGLEEVKDSILKVLKSYTDAITNGIKGGLSNTDASNLIKIADNLGVNDLHFEQTTEGLKLAQQSAIELYQALARVDALQGKIVFDKLAESLKESNEHFATTPALLNRIADLTRIINGMRDNTLAADERVSDARLEQYKAELEVAKEIVAVRSAAEDDSFNFMNNKIPAGQNNPLNYAKNWTKALKSIKDAYKVSNSYDLNAGGVKRTRTGYMGYEDFYNVINEINNMAGMMNQPITIGKDLNGKAIQLKGDLTSASEAIMAGIETLTAVDTGDMMINIGALGINLAKSGSELEKGIDKGIDAVADAQIKALDGMIAMLELIVQMEELGDIAGEDMVIELPDIVTDNPDFDKDMNGLSDNFDAWREKFLAAGSKSKELADAITINGQKMSEWLMRAANEWTEDDAAILNALYQAAISTDWNLDDIGGSLQQMLNSGKFGELAEGFTITLDDVVYTIQHGVVVEAADFSDKDAQEVLKQYKADHQNEKLTDAQAQTRIVEAIQKYLNGEGASDGLTVTQILKLRHNTLIKTDEKGNDYIELTGKGGKTQRYDSNTPQFRAAVQAQILKDQGIDSKNIIPNYDAGTAEANVSYGIKTQTHFTVSANDDGTVEWNLANGDSLAKYATTGKTYRTQTDLLKDIYKNLKEAAVKGDDFAKEAVNGASTFESFIYLHYGIHLQIQTEVYKTGADGKPIKVDDPTKDPKLQQELKPYLNGEKEIKFNNNNEGKTTVTLGNGYTIQLDTDDISIEGEVNQDLLRAKLAEIFGIDAGLKETITTAISEALSSLPETLSSLNESAPTAAADALSNLASAATTLAGIPWSTIAEGMASLKAPEGGGNLPTGNSQTSGDATGTGVQGVLDQAKANIENTDLESPSTETGAQVSAGLAEGASSGQGAVIAALVAVASALLNALKATLQVNSPSKATMEMGKYLDEGLSEGMSEGQSNVTTAAGELGTVAVQAIGDAINEGLQTLPASIEQSDLKDQIAKIFESIGDYAAETFLKEFGTLGAQLASDVSGQAGSFKEAMKPAAEAISSGMNEALTEFENRTVSTLGSVRSHWNTLVTNVIGAVSVIMALIQTMQQKISITWDINTPFGNLAGKGSGNKGTFDPWTRIKEGIQKGKDEAEIYQDIVNDYFASLSSNPPEVPINTEESQKKLDDLKDNLDEISKNGETELKTTSNLNEAEQQTTAIRENLESIQENENIDLSITGNFNDVPAQLANINQSLKEISSNSNININANVSGSRKDEEDNGSPNKGTGGGATEPSFNQPDISENITVPVIYEPEFTPPTIEPITSTVTYVVDVTGDPIPGPVGSFDVVYNITTKGSPPGGGCFVAGTKIYMADGTIKNIEDIYLDDVVIAYNPDTNEFIPKKVIDGYTHHNTARIVEVTFSDGTILKMTPSHPILTTKGWRSLDPITSLDEHGVLPTWLKIGDKVNGYHGEIEIININELSVPKNYDTYDFEVEDCHTFLAEGIPVHNVMVTKGKAKGNATWLNPMGQTFAKGNAGGQALASGRTRTLMGELGPELYVSGGRYFIAGQNGAEFVNLPDDAIVFNHKQTESLMSKGQTGHGKPVTSEKNAISWAKGNINGGPAMASASAALAALKQLRAMWESLKSASVSDLAGAGGGGGGGGGGEKEKVIDPKAWVDTVERWFNLMQEIAALERQITHEETLRSKIQSEWIKDGKAYVKSQKLSLESIKAQTKAQEELNISRRDYFNKRIEALEKEPLGKLYTFDAETGKMQFKDSIINGKDGVMEFLTDLVGFDNLKGANHTNKEKYEILMAAGFGDYMKFDESGNEIKMDADNNGETTDEERESFYENTTKAFWSHIDEFKASTESLWESIAEGENKILELETSRNEIYQEMRDNQMEVEDAVLAAIEDMKQREIDALSDEREALEASTQEYIQGLSDALDKEREMYETQEQEDELNRKRRRLGILERSGASAADITSLQQEIDDQERDLYFDIQQQQIDAIQEASDKEIERLDNQIDIMTQQLEFQKEYGLLWSDVYQVMNSSAQQIASFIMNGNSEFWASSPLNTADGFNERLFEADKWKAYQKDMGSVTDWAKFEMQEKTAAAFNTYDAAMKSQYGESYDQGNRYMKAGGYKEIFDSVYKDTADLTKATEAARKTYTNHKNYFDREALAKRYNQPWMKGDGNTTYQSIDDNQHWAFKYAKETINGVEGYYFQSATKENHDWANGECSKCHHKQPAPAAAGGDGSFVPPLGCGATCNAYCKGALWNDGSSGCGGCSGTCSGSCGGTCTNSCTGGPNSKVGGYTPNPPKKSASGGYVGHGIYELGEQGTETVLTAQQTRILRNNILSNRPNSLISLLKSYNQGYSQISKPLTGITTTEDNSTTIEKVELNMNVQKIANDYDAKRAGEQALSEMLRIAKKTSAANSVRR